MKNTVMTALSDLAARLAGARTGLEALHATETELRGSHERLQAERSQLCSAHPPREDLVAEAERQIDAAGAAWLEVHGAAIVTALSGSIDFAPTGEIRGVVAGQLLPVLRLDGEALLALAPDQLKRGVRRIIEAAAYVAGPAMRERPRLIAEVDAKITEVERQHSELVDRARELGVGLALLPEVQGRRLQAGHRRKRWEDDQRANASYYARHPDRSPVEPAE